MPTTLKRSADEAFAAGDSNNRDRTDRLRFQLRRAQATLGVADARTMEMASQFDENDVRRFQAAYNKPKAAHEVLELQIKLKEAEGSKKDEPEFLNLFTRRAEAGLVLVGTEQKLKINTDVRR
jgi:hypothetical protein